MKLPDRRYIVWGLGLAATAALPILAGFVGFGWELAEIAGLAAVVACLLLGGSPIRPRDSTPPTLISLRRHEALGLVALALAVLHVVCSVVADRKVIEYLKFTSPLYQLAGIIAFLVLLALAATSLETSRRKLWRSHRDFQATHIVLGCLLVVLLAVHVITANRYTGSNGRRVLFIAAAAGGMALLLQRRRGGSAPSEDGTIIRRTVFGRHSTLVVAVITAAVLAIMTLVVSRAGIALREPLLGRSQALPLNFDHGKHAAVNCLACHHNYADGRGFDGCIHCHSSTRSDLKVGIEARFHDFCLTCHRHPAPEFQRHGPVSGCTSCHQPLDAGAARPEFPVLR